MAEKLWQGAFEGASEEVILYNSAENIMLDEKLVFHDIIGSLAHVKMLSKQKLITANEEKQICAALKSIFTRNKEGRFVLSPSLEDVHTNVEAEVSTITPAGKKMHMARSRNDQVLLDTRLYLRQQILLEVHALINLQKAFASLAKKDGPMVGYTHTRVAQPITISSWCASWNAGIARDLGRLMDAYKRVNENPLGAGALTGTDFPIDRKYTAKLLAFDSVQESEQDAISSRWEAEAELLSAQSILMARLSSLSEELIWLSQKGLILIPDSFCTGSSMMPNKKNPDLLEITRGRSARLFANLMQVLAVKKGLLSGYNSDLQETKRAIMDGCEITLGSAAIVSKLVPELEFDSDAIRAELEGGYSQATQIADALALKGVPFREAHGMAGKLVGECAAAGIGLSEASPLSPLSEKEWAAAVSIERARLKVRPKISTDIEKKAEGEKKKISNAYEALLK